MPDPCLRIWNRGWPVNPTRRDKPAYRVCPAAHMDGEIGRELPEVNRSPDADLEPTRPRLLKEELPIVSGRHRGIFTMPPSAFYNIQRRSWG